MNTQTPQPCLSNLGAPHPPLVSVIIATCAAPERVERCLRSLAAAEVTDWEAIVADNRPAGSTVREHLQRCGLLSERVRVVDVAQQGLSAARNGGLAAASGEIVAFLDDDVTVDPAWLGAVVEAFERSGADCVTGKILPASLASREEQLFEQLAALGKGERAELFSAATAERHGGVFPYGAGAFGSGASIAMRRSAARALGGFDTRLGAGTPTTGGEDLDLFVRLINRGGTIYYEPQAVIYHEHPSTMRAIRQRAYRYGLGLTAMLMAQLAGGPRRPLLRAVPAGLRHLCDSGSRKNATRARDYPRSLTLLELAGMALGPVAWLYSAVIGARVLAPAAPAPSIVSAPPAGKLPESDASADVFRPTAACAVDLDERIRDLDFGLASSGRSYGSALVLARIHGQPLATVEVELSGGRIGAAALAEQLWAAVEDRLHEHARRHGCLSPWQIAPGRLRAGLGRGCPEAAVAGAAAPFVTVIVPTAGRPERIRPLLASLTELSYPSFDVLIVDNKPSDPRTRAEVEACASAGAPVRYTAEPLPGSSVARNRGVRESTSEILAFTDDDVAVDREWLSWMVTPFVRDLQVGVVTGLVMPARFDTPEQRWFEELSGFGKGFERRSYDADAQPDPPRFLYPYWGAVFGSGNSMAFRRAVLEQIGGLDPALGAGSLARAGADIESFTHALLRGHRLLYEPRAVCWHDHRTSAAALQRQTFNYGIGCTAIFTKWVLRDPRLLKLAVAQGIGVLRARRSRGRAQELPHELQRLGQQVRAHRGRGSAVRQVCGFALGPVMYARSRAWARRLGLRDILPPSGS